MSNSQRRKGNRGENELVGYLRAHGYQAQKVSAMYRPGPDVEAFGGRVIEVKLRANPISKKLHDLAQDVNMVVTRADRDDWYCYLKLSELLDLIDEGPDS